MNRKREMRGVGLLFPKSEDILFYKKLNTQSKEAIWVAFKEAVDLACIPVFIES